MKGVTLIHDFISKDDEKFIIAQLPQDEPKRGIGRGNIWRYGTKAYKDAFVSETIPEYLQDISKELCVFGYLNHLPSHISINRYEAGQGILPHIDNKASGEILTIVSLASEAIMELSKGKEQVVIKLPRRSLLQLFGEARWDWKHSILPVKDTRYSIVFRA